MAAVDEGAVVELLAGADWVFGPAEGFDDGEDDDGLLEEPLAVALWARNATNRFARKGLLVGMTPWLDCLTSFYPSFRAFLPPFLAPTVFFFFNYFF